MYKYVSYKIGLNSPENSLVYKFLSTSEHQEKPYACRYTVHTQWVIIDIYSIQNIVLDNSEHM